MSRIGTIRNKLGNADAALITHGPDIRWAVGFTGSNSLLLVDRSNARLLTDNRYTEQARAEVQEAEIVIADDGLWEHLREEDWLRSQERVIFQADHLTVSQFEKLQEAGEGNELVRETNFLSKEVASKEEEEVVAIEHVLHVTSDVFDNVIPKIRPGVTEHELAAEITYQHLRRGCSEMAFDPIVASGSRSALPHARPSDKRLQAGEPVLLDFGGVFNGYCSDCTRTVFLGEPAEKQKAAYQAVLDAQEAAFEATNAGVAGSDIDGAARHSLASQGLSEFFSHGTGHGIGLEVHEWPRLSKTSEDIIPEGATVTIEPGVYFPGEFGIRIEDVVVVEANGCRNLTPATKELLVL